MNLTVPRTAPEIAAFLGWADTRAEWGYFDPRTGWQRLEPLTPGDLRGVAFGRVLGGESPHDPVVLSLPSQQPMRAVPHGLEIVARLSRR